MKVDEEQLWKAVLEHDAGRDGTFVYGVTTTGVFCKPSCGSRRPLRKNVRFYASPEEAKRDGLRSCMRCRPDAAATHDEAVRAMRDAIAAIGNDPTGRLDVNKLARQTGMSASHFHRTFRRAMGVTPKQYMNNLRVGSLKQELRRGADVTQSVYASGYGSSSRVYERSDAQLGMTPAQYRAKGEGVTITYVCVPSPLGRMMLGATDRGLCFLQFGESCSALLELLKKEYSKATLEPMAKPFHADFQRWIDALHAYLNGAEISLELPVNVRATAFQLRVWEYLRSIPYGQVQSYSEIASKLGNPSAVRAVAGACAANTVALLVPCHRVIRNNGELGGYRWGLARKRTLLDLERNVSTATASPTV